MENSDQPNPEKTIVFGKDGKVYRPKPKAPTKQDLESQGIEVEDISLEDLFDKDKKRKLKARKRVVQKKEAVLEMYLGYLETKLVVIDLVKKTNEAIENGEIEGKEIKEGDLVQGYVVRYYDGEVHTPKIEEGSSKYITYPFRVKSKFDCLIVESSRAKRILFGPQKYLWDLLEELPKEKREDIAVTLQIKKVTDDKRKGIVKKPPKIPYEKSPKENSKERYDEFKDFLRSQKEGNITETRVMTETETRQMPNLNYLPEAAETRQMSKQEQEELLRQKQKKVSGRFKFE